ncbi:MAG: hypothetical protein M1826_000478 [Phylliscum demangeonii]|nr:MAG: hypothetical protein M1826_000478 [Phylliscum demangeonii]
MPPSSLSRPAAPSVQIWEDDPRIVEDEIPGRSTASSSSTPSTATADPESRKTRTHLSEEDCLTLIRLCLANKHHHHPGRSQTAFWPLIAGLFESKTGKSIKDPSPIVDRLTAARLRQVERQGIESGRLHAETALKKTLSEWSKHLQDGETARKNRRDRQARLEKWAQDVQDQTDESRTTAGPRKRRRQDRSESENESADDMSESDSNDSDGSRPRKSQRRNNEVTVLMPDMAKVVQEMIDALTALSGTVKSDEVRDREKQVASLREHRSQWEAGMEMRMAEICRKLDAMKQVVDTLASLMPAYLARRGDRAEDC